MFLGIVIRLLGSKYELQKVLNKVKLGTTESLVNLGQLKIPEGGCSLSRVDVTSNKTLV